ncbi:MAG TPA: protein-L-isoaspartate(D-aspartate) O-methyltransferase [Candidatus Binatia bacterium]|nr:protein-L-isoaspartate(D-aspartate) O-methyltransferase [Candidatus Binatia bacterium]
MVVTEHQDIAADRSRLLRRIEEEVRETASYLGTDALDARVRQRMMDVPRHEFVPPEQLANAYADEPLPIGFGQTISQPYIVAAMTQLLRLTPEDVVLEVGTGSGYQTAVLSGLVRKVYSVEIIEPLHRRARATLERLGYGNVELRCGDAHVGWPEHAPYDAILMAAAGPEIPSPLIDQLAAGGRLVAPVDRGEPAQMLVLIVKDADGTLQQRAVLPVAFVPLTSATDHQP